LGDILRIFRKTVPQYELSQQQKTEEFKEKYKKRAFIEGKNAELKDFMAYTEQGDMVY
jgi:hypothetical protein